MPARVFSLRRYATRRLRAMAEDDAATAPLLRARRCRRYTPARYVTPRRLSLLVAITAATISPFTAYCQVLRFDYADAS